MSNGTPPASKTPASKTAAGKTPVSRMPAGKTTAGGPAGVPTLGLTEWFRPNERERVERCLGWLDAIGVRHLRTHLSWADFHGEGGQEWYDWLIPRLAEQVELLPCLHYTPPSLSETGTSAGPPRRLRDYADFVDHILTRYGQSLQTVELWNEPNNLLDWDWRADPDWLKFAEMIGDAAHWARQRGRRVVLGGPCPNDLNWLSLMGERGVFEHVDVLGLHGFPGTWDSEDSTWTGWGPLLAEVGELLRRHNPEAVCWITETGYSTWRADEARQLTALLQVIEEAPVERLYWYSLQDLQPDVAVQEGLWFDPRHYHFGLYDSDGRGKLLARQLQRGGLEAVRKVERLDRRLPNMVGRKPVLVTGGAGFIGCNLADRLAADGHDVLVYDALSRPGVEDNLGWLKQRHPRRVSAAIADLRDGQALGAAAAEARAVFHLAAQVAVTTSTEHPWEDHEVNIGGTLRLLEALRRRREPVPFVFASTNKVYGDLGGVELARGDGGYHPVDEALGAHGIPADWPLELHTPYGCSKGAADQYVLDYARTFGLPATVLRMSCIYGPRQLGTEDQGWVAHFVRRALADEPIVIYGDGHQVRDLLFVADAVEAYLAAWRRIGVASGRAFNLGGGSANAVSLLQVVDWIERLLDRRVRLDFGPWRTGDQRYFVTDARQTRATLGLAEPLGWRDGIQILTESLRELEGQAPGQRGAGASVVPLQAATAKEAMS